MIHPPIQHPTTQQQDRTFSIVVGQNGPQSTCGVYNSAEDLFLASSLQGEPSDYWAILDRQVSRVCAHNNHLSSLPLTPSPFLFYV